MTKVAILQPSYIPWIGYFEQIINVDIFVFYDDVQYTKNDWRNRNKIKVLNGSSWLSIPVNSSTSKNINEVLVDDTKNWRVKHLKSLKQFYSKSKYFDEIYPILQNNINSDNNSLSNISINIIKDISKYLKLDTKFYLSSDLGIGGDKNDRLINICKHFNASSYYSGKAAKNYINKKLFDNNKIELVFQEYEHPSYKQLHGDFLPYLSIIDLLFNYGKNSKKIITKESSDV
ncbi:WbqC family protein [Sulfurimonas sp.]|uniref:WbqC family protein n=1 Tax=Sulfurimonas sp. TaxID=2022749 RepID=UPI002B49C841|nr:WbqC family protein [Sulfurimonas sp.]